MDGVNPWFTTNYATNRFRYNKGEADQEMESGVQAGADRGTESRLERFVG